ncbi:MAG: FHA domain-containing protein [Bryobacterales bacterium]|nr:FHA domain-containing protein [Bryobacterales bacterium]
MFLLDVTAGPRQGERIRVKDGATVTVGRLGTASFAVPNDSTLSGKHFSITVQGNACLIKDEGSSNGTYVNGMRIEQVGVQVGYRVKAGHSEFLVSFLPSFGSWMIPAIPPGWAEIPGRGIQAAQPGRFPTNILFTEEEQELEIPLPEYIQRQQIIVREAIPHVQFAPPAELKLPDAEGAYSMRAQFAATGGALARQRQLYICKKRIVGIISMTTIDTEMPHVDKMFDAVVAKAQFEPEPIAKGA